MAQQENSEIERGVDARLYEVGCRLVHIGYNPQEIPREGDYELPFQIGDLLRVLPRNGCGMGIDVARINDGKIDMVWPEEVQLAVEQAGDAGK